MGVRIPSSQIAASNPLYLGKGIIGAFRFVVDTVSMSKAESIADSVRLPNVLHTVSEFQRVSFLETTRLVLDEPWLVLAGLALFVIAAISRWKKLLHRLSPQVCRRRRCTRPYRRLRAPGL